MRLQRVKVQVGSGEAARTAGAGKQAYVSPTYWIHCPGKAHPRGGISSSRCQDQGKLKLRSYGLQKFQLCKTDVDGGLF